jgi:hypothetical protein
MGNFNKEGQIKFHGSFLEMVAEEVFAVKHLTTVTKKI